MDLLTADHREFDRSAPTRPHPMTPNEAGIRMTVGPIASLLDHLRDRVSGRGKSGN